jgi:outer membrane lipoprotein carrier protein
MSDTRFPAGRLMAVFVFLLFAGSLALPAAAAAPPAKERLDAYLKGLNTLSAGFRQITLAADGGRMMESKGNFYLKRPGRFRWEYQSPVDQLIVADGDRVWLHDRELDQVSHQGQQQALNGTPAQLLATDEPIERHFEVYGWDAGDDREWVELRPKAGSGDVVRIRIGFDGERLDTLLMEDSFGQITRLSFFDIERNPTLDAKLFQFDTSVGGDFLQF